MHSRRLPARDVPVIPRNQLTSQAIGAAARNKFRKA
jgi:hypothetical protein